MKNILTNCIALVLLLGIFSGNVYGNDPNDNFCFDADIEESQIMCLTAPFIMCPSTYLACPNANLDPAVAGMATATPGDAFCPTPTLSYEDVVTMNSSCLMIVHRTWEASYPPGSASIKLHSTCQQTLYLEDNTAPVISGCPSDITVDLANNCAGSATWAIPVANDACQLQSFITTHFSGSNFSLGTTPVTYTATDQCGFQTTCNFNVTVVGSCCTGPTIFCPANVVDCPSSSTNTSVTGMATASNMDPSCGALTVSFSDVVVNNNGNCGTLIERTWTAVESGTNATVNCLQTINTIDSQNPVIMNIPSDMTIQGTGAGCAIPVTWNIPTTTDNCGINSFTSTHNSGTTFPQGSTLVTYTALDNCGNQTTAAFQITIQCEIPCNTPPSISCPGTVNICPTNGIPGVNVTGNATASSSTGCGNPILTFNDVMSSTSGCVGSKVIQRTWTATDQNNTSLFSSCVQMINLVDNTPPQFQQQCPNSITLTGTGTNCSAVATWTIPTATDNCSGNVSVTANSNGQSVSSGSTFGQGSSLITYTASDACGNATTCAFNVTVNCQGCNTNPIISCPSNRVVCINGNTTPAANGSATANGGAFCPTPSVSFNDVNVSTGPCAGAREIQRTWTATYAGVSGYSASCVQMISVKDNTPPTIHTCPQNMTVTSSTAPISWAVPTASDGCGTVTFSSTHNPGTSFPNGTTTVTYTATDNCGNATQCSFTVTVDVPAGGFINCPNDMVLQCGSNGGAVANWTVPQYNGACTACDNGAYISGFIYMGSFGGSQYYCSLSTATWPMAKQICTARGGQLAEINNAAENAYLAQQLSIQSAWIGLSDKESEGHFEWCTGNELGYTNWYQGQPNNYNDNQDYVEMLNSGHWNDQYNTYSLEYIMEIPCSYVSQVSGPAPGTFLQTGTHTVVYNVQDACGSFATCSFDITVEPGLSITCPNNIHVAATNSTGIQVNWNEPQANSCCSNCNNGGGSIPGFIYMGSYNGSYYYCSVASATWATAQQTCVNNGGNLCVINDAGENSYVASLLPLSSAWIGLSDVNTEGQNQWVDGSAVTYSNWYTGQPNNYNGNQDCVEILNTGKWNDQYCSLKLEYVMEISQCITITQTAGPQAGTIVAPGTYTVSYRVTDGCNNVETCSFGLTVDGPAPPTTGGNYCQSGGQISTHHYIQSCGFAQISNVSGNNGGYHDYTNMCTNISAGTTYPLQLTPGYGGGKPHKVYWTVWIDYNMDGDFHDNYEFVAYGCGNKTLSGSVPVPYNIWNGTTRMRVIMKYGGYATDPCQIYTYGETEDYCVNITGGDFQPQDGGDLSQRSSQFADATLIGGEYISGNEVSVYPNPVNSIMTIELGNTENISDMRLYNIEGKDVMTLSVRDSMNTVNVSELDNGIYVLRVNYSDGSIHTERLIIQH